jgi:hypothetical protein
MKSTSALKPGLILLFLMLMLVCCEDDSKSYPDTVFGKWKFISMQSSTIIEYINQEKIEIWDFRKDSVLIITRGNSIIESKFKFSGNELTITFRNDQEYIEQYTIERYWYSLMLYDPDSDIRLFFSLME